MLRLCLYLAHDGQDVRREDISGFPCSPWHHDRGFL
jgi:hypothetical protein